jgi:hypothetical protein
VVSFEPLQPLYTADNTSAWAQVMKMKILFAARASLPLRIATDQLLQGEAFKKFSSHEADERVETGEHERDHQHSNQYSNSTDQPHQQQQHELQTRRRKK